MSISTLAGTMVIPLAILGALALVYATSKLCRHMLR